MGINPLDFPMLKETMHGKPLIYFDTAATAQKPQAVIDCLTHFYSSEYATVHRAIYQISVEASRKYHMSRLTAQKFLNAAHPEEIIFTRGTTESINLVAYSFGKRFIQAGDEVVISEMEHHSNIVPWQILCEDRGAILKVVPFDDRGVLIYDEYLKALSPKTKIVSITHISNALGTINPIKQMISDAHKVGAKVLIDACQSAPHMPLDVQDLDCDFLVFSGHKVYGPTGIGVLYGKADLLNEMPPYQSGGDMIHTVTFEKTTYNVLPMKFEAGTPIIAEVIGLGAALNYLMNIGLDKIHEHEKALFEQLNKAMKTIPEVRLIGTAPQKGGIVSFVVEGVHPLDIGTMLDLKGIAIRTGHVCAQPAVNHFNIPGIARVSLGLYNTPQEVDQFINNLKQIIKLF